MSTFSAKTRLIVAERSGGVCERCLQRHAAHHHHRLAKGMGGSKQPWMHLPANDGHVCSTCHDWIHAHPDESYETGWLISRYSAGVPEYASLEDLIGNRFFFTDDGRRETA